MYKITMKIFPILLLGMLILPESLIHVPIFPFGKANAHPIHVSNDDHHNISHVVVDIKTTEKGLECDACMYLANGLNETVLHNPKVLAIVTEDLEKVCSVLPQSVQALCTNAAEQTAPLLLNHLGDFIATEGCSDLGVCHTTHHP
jgi:hypothetical protein